MTNSNSINLAALGFGGIDTSTLVTSLVALEQQPVNALQTKQQGIQSASSTLSSFSTTLSQLSSAATALADPTTFTSLTATSSDPSIVATSTGSPKAGQYSLAVQQIAQAQRTISNGTADTTTALGVSGTLAITLGSGSTAQTANVTLTADESLSDIANSISQQAGLPAQVSTYYDGSQYHLLVAGSNTGTANQITFDESGLTSTGYQLGLSVSTNTKQPAQNANLTIDGVPYSSSTNLVTGALPGVSLALTQPTTSPARITVASDTSAMTKQIQSFVTAYNAVISAGHADAGYGTQAASNALLQGDSAVRSTLDQLSQLMAEQVPGSSGTYTSLASIGLDLNTDGTLTFNQSKFTTAIQADPAGVQKLFTTDANSGSTGVMGALNSAINSLTDPTNGAISAELQSFASRNSALGSQVSALQLQVQNYQTMLQAEFTQMNTMLAHYKQQSTALTQQFNQNSSNSNSVL